jgi:hypothetical protein
MEHSQIRTAGSGKRYASATAERYFNARTALANLLRRAARGRERRTTSGRCAT